ncbi:(2Fe-2S) ferredoxin domain-containing protein [Salinithrix halophila]|uniref:Ferredoxin n=1 Tax=Salinithrix halophila TaxID=1485204 RepID=A0ABV8JFT9_9BACL
MATWNLSETRHHLLICNGGSCMKQGAEEVTDAIREVIRTSGNDACIHTTRTRCNGRCQDACVVILYPEGTWFHGITPESGRELIRRHVLQNRPLSDRISHRHDGDVFFPMPDIPVGTTKT